MVLIICYFWQNLANSVIALSYMSVLLKSTVVKLGARYPILVSKSIDKAILLFKSNFSNSLFRIFIMFCSVKVCDGCYKVLILILSFSNF